MDDNTTAGSGRIAAYMKALASATQEGKTLGVFTASRSQDQVSISPEALEAASRPGPPPENPPKEVLPDPGAGEAPEGMEEAMGRLKTAAEAGVPELRPQFRAGQDSLGLVIDQNRDIDPDGSIALKAYMESYALQAAAAREAIAAYYAAAHEENMACSQQEALERLEEKYLRPESPYFRTDLSEGQREMAFRQEKALLTGSRLDLSDPYALAAAGGMQKSEEIQWIARQEAQDALFRARNQLKGKDW